MGNATRVAAAVTAGYLLGRTKKLKLAITVGSMLAGKRIATDPRALVRQAGEIVESNEELSRLSDEVRSKLLGAARAAALSAGSSRLDQLSDSLHERSDRWRSGTTQAVEAPAEKATTSAKQADGDGKTAAKKTAKKSTAKKTAKKTPAKEASAKKTTKKAPAKKTTKKAPAKKAAAKTTKKAGS